MKKIRWHKNGWECPKCGRWNRSRGEGRRIRKCGLYGCGFKAEVQVMTKVVSRWEKQIVYVKHGRHI